MHENTKFIRIFLKLLCSQLWIERFISSQRKQLLVRMKKTNLNKKIQTAMAVQRMFSFNATSVSRQDDPRRSPVKIRISHLSTLEKSRVNSCRTQINCLTVRYCTACTKLFACMSLLQSGPKTNTNLAPPPERHQMTVTSATELRKTPTFL